MHCLDKVEAVGVKELARKDSHLVRGVVREVDVAEERCLEIKFGACMILNIGLTEIFWR